MKKLMILVMFFTATVVQAAGSAPYHAGAKEAARADSRRKLQGVAQRPQTYIYSEQVRPKSELEEQFLALQKLEAQGQFCPVGESATIARFSRFVKSGILTCASCLDQKGFTGSDVKDNLYEVLKRMEKAVTDLGHTKLSEVNNPAQLKGIRETGINAIAEVVLQRSGGSKEDRYAQASERFEKLVLGDCQIFSAQLSLVFIDAKEYAARSTGTTGDAVLPVATKIQ